MALAAKAHDREVFRSCVVQPYAFDFYRLGTRVVSEAPRPFLDRGKPKSGCVLSRRAKRASLSVGFTAMLVGLFVGTAVGVVAGFFRKLDAAMMAVTDLFLSLPLLPLLLVVILLFRDRLKDHFGPTLGIFILVVAIIGMPSWTQTARVVRGDVLSIKEQEFVLAARSIGTRKQRLITRHIIPNVMSSVIVAASLGVAGAILLESALSFLGLGFPADFPTWGRLLFESRNYLSLNPARVIWPGVLISLTVMSVNFVGDGLRDALDPKLRSKG